MIPKRIKQKLSFSHLCIYTSNYFIFPQGKPDVDLEKLLNKISDCFATMFASDRLAVYLQYPDTLKRLTSV